MQVDFVHKPNEHLIIDYWIIHFMNGLLNRQTESFFYL